MYKQTVKGTKGRLSTRNISSTYMTILLGRAVMNGYNVEKSDDCKYIVVFQVDNEEVRHEYTYCGWDYETEKILEHNERHDGSW